MDLLYNLKSLDVVFQSNMRFKITFDWRYKSLSKLESGIKWQFFISETDDAMRLYPGVITNEVNYFKHSYSKWYIQAVTLQKVINSL